MWLALACAAPREPEDPSGWFDPGTGYDVLEPLLFTDVPYTFTGETPIGAMPTAPEQVTWFSPADAPQNEECADWDVSNALPVEISGVVTNYPRYYYKARSGCQPSPDIESAEKYYGSYFLQDASGGTFVLRDSKVADFLAGDRVTLEVRAVKDSFGLDMVAVHDVLSIERGPEPIYYEVPVADLGAEHVARVMRVTGTVTTEMTTFGELQLVTDDGFVTYDFTLDAELTRRGVEFPVGARLEVTGPVIYSFGTYSIVVMQLGQIREL